MALMATKTNVDKSPDPEKGQPPSPPRYSPPCVVDAVATEEGDGLTFCGFIVLIVGKESGSPSPGFLRRVHAATVMEHRTLEKLVLAGLVGAATAMMDLTPITEWTLVFLLNGTAASTVDCSRVRAGVMNKQRSQQPCRTALFGGMSPCV